MAVAGKKALAIFFSSGGLGDVGRHSILVALEDPRVKSMKVFASPENMKTLDFPNWKCNCQEPHDLKAALKQAGKPLEKVEINLSNSKSTTFGDTLSRHLNGVDAVLSCMGNRQPFWGDRVAAASTKHITEAMAKNNIQRLVAMTSMGLNEDYPCMEWRFEGKIMDTLFLTICRPARNDLLKLESIITSSKPEVLDYLLVRPVGLGEEVVPEGKYFLQKKKFEDELGANIAKADCARFFVDQAVEPTLSRRAVVIGSDPEGIWGTKKEKGEMN